MPCSAEPLPARPRAVGLARALERLFTGHRNEGIQRWIEPFDHVETLARKTHRREAVTKLSQRPLDRVRGGDFSHGLPGRPRYRGPLRDLADRPSRVSSHATP